MSEPATCFTVGRRDEGKRLDHFLHERIPGLSRTRIQGAIRERVSLSWGVKARASTRVRAGGEIRIAHRELNETLLEIDVEVLVRETPGFASWPRRLGGRRVGLDAIAVMPDGWGGGDEGDGRVRRRCRLVADGTHTSSSTGPSNGMRAGMLAVQDGHDANDNKRDERRIYIGSDQTVPFLVVLRPRGR